MASNTQQKMEALKKVMDNPEGAKALEELFNHASHSGSISYLEVAGTIAEMFLTGDEADAFVDLTVQPEI